MTNSNIKLKAITKSVWIDETITLIKTIEQDSDWQAVKAKAIENNILQKDKPQTTATILDKIRERFIEQQNGKIVQTPFIKIIRNSAIPDEIKRQVFPYFYAMSEPLFKEFLIHCVYTDYTKGDRILTREEAKLFLENIIKQNDIQNWSDITKDKILI